MKTPRYTIGQLVRIKPLENVEARVVLVELGYDG